jgi:hypothetical protein
VSVLVIAGIGVAGLGAMFCLFFLALAFDSDRLLDISGKGMAISFCLVMVGLLYAAVFGS